MSRKKKLFLNSASSLAYQFIAVVCGFILPRMFLTYYGSEVNGLISSINHFLGFITIGDLGVGAVVQSALYKPLASNNTDEISRIYVSSNRFFRKISLVLWLYMGILALVYPLITIDKFSYGFTALLVLAMAISSYAQYFMCITYRLILNADQLSFCWLIIHSMALLVNTFVCAILMKTGMSVQIVKLVTSIIFLAQPACIYLIVNKRYSINKKIIITEEPIKQKWNGLAQHIATVVLNNTDTVVLTLLSTLSNVSIYSVYFLVVNGVKQIIISLTNGVQALFGNMLANGETKKLNDVFSAFEWLLHTFTTFIFSCTVILIVPFVSVYTRNINDADYIAPIFGILITFAQASYCLRMPYNLMVLAAGHYKDTQASAVLEAVINITVSVILVYHFGLVGVAIGTLVAMIYRTVYLAYYLSKNILNRPIKFFIIHMIVDIISVASIMITSYLVFGIKLTENSYITWSLFAIKTLIIALMWSIAFSLLVYRKEMKRAMGLLLRRFGR
jgi:O-antigen/teichoic acid export membrane protein